MACLAGLGGGIYALASGGSKKETGPNNTPPINASSSDEADFVKCANTIIRPLRFSHADFCTGSSSSPLTRSKKFDKGIRWMVLYEEVYIQLAHASKHYLGPMNKTFAFEDDQLSVYYGASSALPLAFVT